MRTACRGCESKDLVELLDFGNMPLAGGFLSGSVAIEKEILYPLAVHICARCALIQILNPIDPEILFQDYSFSSTTIQPLVAHFENYAHWIIEKFQPESVVEFGCNDGVLLTPLNRLGIRTIGVDVSKNITDIVRKKNIDVITGYFNNEIANQIYARYGSVDIVTGSNTFAHNDHPERILEAARSILKENGILCLEVMYAGDLLELLQWDTLYHEHLTFYSLSSLRTLLERFGFFIFYAERIPMHGGSLRIAAGQKRGTQRSQSMERIIQYEAEHGIADIQTWTDFAVRSRRTIEIVKKVFSALSRDSRIWSYGAAGKATMWVNACSMTYLDGVVDASPLRSGKLMPGTHTPIVTPEEFKKDPPDIMFVSAWNYAEHIQAKESWYQGVWSVPLPVLKFY